MAQPQADVVSQLLPTLISIQQVLQQFVQNLATLVPVPTLVLALAPPVVELVHEELAQGVTPHADNLSAARHPSSIAKVPTIFVTRANVEALV